MNQLPDHSQFAADLADEFRGEVQFHNALPDRLEPKHIHIGRGQPYVTREGNKLTKRLVVVISGHRDAPESGFAFIDEIINRVLPILVKRGAELGDVTVSRSTTTEPNMDAISAFMDITLR